MTPSYCPSCGVRYPAWTTHACLPTVQSTSTNWPASNATQGHLCTCGELHVPALPAATSEETR